MQYLLGSLFGFLLSPNKRLVERPMIVIQATKIRIQTSDTELLQKRELAKKALGF